MNELRRLPSMEALLQAEAAQRLVAQYGRSLTLDALREIVSQARELIRQNKVVPPPVPDVLLAEAAVQLQRWLAPSLLGVINASGVILHTNLGRAPLSQAALQALAEVGPGYSTLEYDLERGARGSRSQHAETLLTRLSGAEAALVVNNNAAALLLALSALARRKRVVISRSQLVEVGGGFRIPEVMGQSGARLVEVGATNRVNLEDYRQALTEPTALVLRAHHSNYKISGFTSEVGLAELVELAHAQAVPVLDDLGSGALLDTAQFGLAHEPMVQESLQAGADLVCFSGDKLLGGPQAGILLGRKALVEKIKKHPLARAVRADKLCLAALSATLGHYLRGEAVQEIPVWRMIATPAETLRAQAGAWRDALGCGMVLPSCSTVGGGSLPEEQLPTYVLALGVRRPERLMTVLRQQHPPVVARIEDDHVVFDPRTVLPGQAENLLQAIRAGLGTIESMKRPQTHRGEHEE